MHPNDFFQWSLESSQISSTDSYCVYPRSSVTDVSNAQPINSITQATYICTYLTTKAKGMTPACLLPSILTMYILGASEDPTGTYILYLATDHCLEELLCVIWRKDPLDIDGSVELHYPRYVQRDYGLILVDIHHFVLRYLQTGIPEIIDGHLSLGVTSALCARDF